MENCLQTRARSRGHFASSLQIPFNERKNLRQLSFPKYRETTIKSATSCTLYVLSYLIRTHFVKYETGVAFPRRVYTYIHVCTLFACIHCVYLESTMHTMCVCVCVCDTSVQVRYTRVVLAARILRNTFDDC